VDEWVKKSDFVPFEGEEVYGGYELRIGGPIFDFQLKHLGAMTMEPVYTQFTGHKMPVDYIWYQGPGLRVVRTMDVPSYSKVM